MNNNEATVKGSLEVELRLSCSRLIDSSLRKLLIELSSAARTVFLKLICKRKTVRMRKLTLHLPKKKVISFWKRQIEQWKKC